MKRFAIYMFNNLWLVETSTKESIPRKNGETTKQLNYRRLANPLSPSASYKSDGVNNSTALEHSTPTTAIGLKF